MQLHCAHFSPIIAITVFFALFSFQIQATDANTCYDNVECAFDSHSGTANCYGYFACLGGTIASAATHYCYGSYGCYELARFYVWSGTHYNAQCYGLYSCAEIEDWDTYDGNAHCYGELSCSGIQSLQLTEDNMNCLAERACEGSDMLTEANNNFYGFMAGKDAILTARDGSVVYYFYGSMSGYGATIYCITNCYIYCYGDSCYGLNLLCYSGYSCTFHTDCTAAEQSTVCPNGYTTRVSESEKLSYINDYYLSTVATTYENSADACFTSVTNALQCDDYQECAEQSVETSESNVGAVCCTASEGCRKATTIASYIDTSESNEYNNIAIRCDGYLACDSYGASVTANIEAKNGGNIYFSGGYSGRYVGSVTSGDPSSTTVSCGGIYSCQGSYNIHNVWNVFCGGPYSCESAKISSVLNNVWVTGYQGAKQATIQNVENVICQAYESCYQTKIKGVNKIIANSYNAIAGSVIISESPNNELFFAIAGSSTERIELYCNATDTCNIDCQSSDACSKLELRCTGQCYVDCNADEGIACPFYGYYSSWDAPNITTFGSFDEYVVEETAEPTVSPTQQPIGDDYVCDLINDELFASWDSVNGDSSYISDFIDPSITLTQGNNDITNVFEINIKVQAKYLVVATYDSFEEFYEEETENGYLGVTYVLDFNVFHSNGRLLQDANKCENRLSNSFENKHFLHDFWDYSLDIANNQSMLGNDKYLEYGNQNIWDLTLVDARCGMIEWEHTFSFFDLITTCKSDNYNDDLSFILTESDSKIKFEFNLYLTLVSPHPVYLTACDSGATDCGTYITRTLASHTINIEFDKQKSVISDNNNILIDLFTASIISSQIVSGENGGSTVDLNISYFELVMITSVPYYIALDIDTLTLLSPSISDLQALNNGLEFIQGITITENRELYLAGDCLITTSYRCFQQFTINIEVNQCPSQTGLIFDGNYIISGDFTCRDLDNDGSISTSEQDTCDSYDSASPLAITLDSVSISYTEGCDSTTYTIDWDASMNFYDSDEFTQISTEFAVGDTVFVKISMEDEFISNYLIFGMSIQQCYLCMPDSDENNSTAITSCFHSSVSELYNIQQDSDLEFDLINGNISDLVEEFSFVLPVLSVTSSILFFVDCSIELELLNGNQLLENVTVQSSRRMLLDEEDEADDIVSANVFSNAIAYGIATPNLKISKNDDDNSIAAVLSEYWWIIALVLCFGLGVCCAVWYTTLKTKILKENVQTAVDIVR